MITRRWAWAEVDLGALDHNIKLLCDVVHPSALWAVVKANGYGHGAIEVAQQAITSGAAGLCVALTGEGVALRDAGIDAPILVLSPQPADDADDLVRHRLIPTVTGAAHVDAIAAAARRGAGAVAVHVKVDTGMQRVGAHPDDVVALVAHVHSAPSLTVAGVFTHLACADETASPANDQQLSAFDRVLDDLAVAGFAPPAVHAANSAAALAIPRSRRSLVRVGIAMYGISPGAGVDQLVSGLRPVLSLRARVSQVKRVVAGSHVSYGWCHRFDHDTTVATMPLGYADGVPRRLGTLPDRPGADVLVGGRRCPIVGVVTMDQLMVDVGDAPVAVGDEVVLLGEQGGETIHAEQWAVRLGTIGYEIACGISTRVPRVQVPPPGAFSARTGDTDRSAS